MKAKNSPKQPSKSIHELGPYLIQAWRHLVRSSGPSDYLLTREFRLCTSSVAEFQKLFKDQVNWTQVWQRSPLFGAYMTYFWPIHYQQARSIFQQQSRALGRVLDVGSGPGAFTLAALECFSKEVVALDSSERCLMLLSEFAARLGHTLSIREWRYPEPLMSIDGTFDTITLGHSLLEIAGFDLKQSMNLIQMLVHHLSPGGKILIVENDDPKRRKVLTDIQRSVQQPGPSLHLRPQAKLQELSLPFERTRLMHDIMRSLKRQELKSELLILSLDKPAL